MTFFWIIVIIVVVWWLASRSRGRAIETTTENMDEVNSKITEEVVFKAQTRFEKKLEEEIDFPDAITHRDIYIYRNLMRIWYNKLVGENRYNEEMIQKLRNDWLDYMYSIEHSNTSHYLSMEMYDEKDNTKSDSYGDEHIMASRKIFAIEDALAALLGKEAVEELNRVRKLDFDQFDKRGNLAPAGHRFNFSGKLEKIKKGDHK